MSICVFPGSFDPPTLGHIDILKRASKIFDTVYAAILINCEKTPFFALEKRILMLSKCFANENNILVESFDGLLADYAVKINANAIVRGVRDSYGFSGEYVNANVNKLLCGVETVFLASAPEYSFISSTVVRDILSHGGDVSCFLPENIIDMI